MLRPVERVFTDAATAHLEFLALDELHTYRGRQGADIAMLMRRLRERSGNRRLLNIGTSATMASGGKRDDRRRAAAEVATKLFGTLVPPENVVDESLRRAIEVPAPQETADIRRAFGAPTPQDLKTFAQSPLAAWTENAFGLDEEDGRLIRRKPITFREGARQLSQQSGEAEFPCTGKLLEILASGNKLRNDMGIRSSPSVFTSSSPLEERSTPRLRAPRNDTSRWRGSTTRPATAGNVSFFHSCSAANVDRSITPANTTTP